MGLKGHRKINFLDAVNALHSQIIFFFGRINVIEFNVVIKAFFTKGNSLVDFDDIQLIDPDFLAKFSTDVRGPGYTRSADLIASLSFPPQIPRIATLGLLTKAYSLL